MKKNSNRSKNSEPKNTNLVRLNKYIASCGVASRRKADWLILDGKVRVNGKTITEVGVQVDPVRDAIVVNNKLIRAIQDNVYVMFHKPAKVVTTMNDPEGRPCISDYLDKAKIRLFPVGRLDWDSEGLLLLTNDGAFAQKVAHPKHHVAKTYMVKLDGQPTDQHLQKLTKGISIIGGKAHALAVRRMEGRGSDKYDWVKIIINEGRNRQIRMMFEKLGFDVKKLQRVAIGALKIGTLERGKIKILFEDDLKKIFQQPKELRDKPIPAKLRDSRRRLHKRVE
ncbi:MAG: rRNA pseudouridine synthase [Bdellovibrionales bacterium]|nr:rRNA pseudouridine synthase [Bdellovibrionales bacterium]